jgi:acyl-CoA thioesterase superfamily protein
MTIFDEATAVERVGDGVYLARPDPRFALVAPGGRPPPAVNGGVLIATVLRAVLDGSPLPHPVATSAHFLRVARLAPAEIHVTWLKTGRTAATARATLIQGGEAVLETTVTTGRVPASRPVADGRGTARRAGNGSGLGQAGQGRSLGADVELNWTDAAPVLPSPDECVELGPWRGTVAPDGTAGYAAQIRMLFDPAVIGWVRDEPSGLPEMRGYARRPRLAQLAAASPGPPAPAPPAPAPPAPAPPAPAPRQLRPRQPPPAARRPPAEEH